MTKQTQYPQIDSDRNIATMSDDEKNQLIAEWMVQRAAYYQKESAEYLYNHAKDQSGFYRTMTKDEPYKSLGNRYKQNVTFCAATANVNESYASYMLGQELKELGINFDRTDVVGNDIFYTQTNPKKVQGANPKDLPKINPIGTTASRGVTGLAPSNMQLLYGNYALNMKKHNIKPCSYTASTGSSKLRDYKKPQPCYSISSFVDVKDKQGNGYKVKGWPDDPLIKDGDIIVCYSPKNIGRNGNNGSRQHVITAHVDENGYATYSAGNKAHFNDDITRTWGNKIMGIYHVSDYNRDCAEHLSAQIPPDEKNKLVAQILQDQTLRSNYEIPAPIIDIDKKEILEDIPIIPKEAKTKEPTETKPENVPLTSVESVESDVPHNDTSTPSIDVVSKTKTQAENIPPIDTTELPTTDNEAIIKKPTERQTNIMINDIPGYAHQLLKDMGVDVPWMNSKNLKKYYEGLDKNSKEYLALNDLAMSGITHKSKKTNVQQTIAEISGKYKDYQPVLETRQEQVQATPEQMNKLLTDNVFATNLLLSYVDPNYSSNSYKDTPALKEYIANIPKDSQISIALNTLAVTLSENPEKDVAEIVMDISSPYRKNISYEDLEKQIKTDAILSKKYAEYIQDRTKTQKITAPTPELAINQEQQGQDICAPQIIPQDRGR